LLGYGNITDSVLSTHFLEELFVNVSSFPKEHWGYGTVSNVYSIKKAHPHSENPFGQSGFVFCTPLAGGEDFICPTQEPCSSNWGRRMGCGESLPQRNSGQVLQKLKHLLRYFFQLKCFSDHII